MLLFLPLVLPVLTVILVVSALVGLIKQRWDRSLVLLWVAVLSAAVTAVLWTSAYFAWDVDQLCGRGGNVGERFRVRNSFFPVSSVCSASDGSTVELIPGWVDPVLFGFAVTLPLVILWWYRRVSTAGGRRPVLVHLLLLAYYGVFGAWITVQTRSDAELPSANVVQIPNGLTVIRDSGSCLSGSCLRRLIVDGPPGMSGAEIAATLDLPLWTCRTNGFLDKRRLCVGAEQVGDVVRVSLMMADLY